ncbi:ABC transporter permease, partial [Leucobacter sp. OLES1]
MSVPAFLLRRAGGLLLVLFVTSFIVFGLMYLAPGSPLSFVLGPRGGTPEQIAAVTAQYHLNDPFIVRYFAWLGDLFQGNLGDSIVY